jgi:hypothetical protein
LLLVFLLLLKINLDFRRRQGDLLNKVEVGITYQLSSEVEEGFLVVVVGFRRDFVILKVLFAMESYLLRFNLTVLDINLVTAENNRDILANAAKITMPSRYILVCKTRSHIKHNNSTLAMNVVTITEATKLFLSCRVPAVETDLTAVGGEVERVNLNTNGGCERELKESGYLSK